MNLYCKLIEKREKSADYAVGSSPNLLDGIVRFYTAEDNPDIIKPWADSALSRIRIYTANRQYREQLAKGDFPEKMSYIVE